MDLKKMFKNNYQLLMFVFFAFFLMVLVSYISISSIMRRQLQSNAVQNLATARSTIETILMEPEIAMINTSLSIKNMLDKGADPQTIEQYLVEFTKWVNVKEEQLSDFNGIYGYLNGEYLDGLRWTPPNDYVVEERPWYKAAVAAGGDTAITSPYIDAQTGRTIITVAQAMYDDTGEMLGVFCIDMQITKLTQYVNTLKLTEDGYGILLGSDLNIIAHPDKARHFTNILDIYPEFEVLNNLKPGEINTIDMDSINGIRKITITEKLNNNWYLGIVTPVKTYYSDIVYVLLILSALGAVLMVILDYFLVRLNHDKLRSDQENLSKSSFLARMSHEIRTPMNAIIGMSEIALREPDITPALSEHVLGIRQAGASLLAIINDILDFSKIEAGKMEIITAAYQFSSLVNDIISIARTRLADKPILFVTNIDCNIPNQLIGDEVRIRQIILNLLNNAVKYTQKGHVSITIKSKVINQDTAAFTFEVTDSGIGIREEDLDKIFENFSQFDAKKNRDIEGTGLGLAIAYNLCMAMNGSIDVTSKYGEGSTFKITLPQKFGEYQKLAEVIDAAKKNVLIYEPREIYASSIKDTVTNLNVKCKLAVSHSTFLEHLNNEAFTHIFVSSFLYDSANKIITKLKCKSQLILLAEFGEIIPNRSIRTIAMPVHAVSITNILNNLSNTAGYNETRNLECHFTAPTAKVLIVDDINTNLKVTAGLLSPYQMTVDCAKSGPEAINLIKHNQYDLVFMDHMMPEMDGIEATTKIRSLNGNKYYREVPIIALTANALAGMEDMFLNNGFNDFLAKPIDTSKLYLMLEKWLPVEKREKSSKIKTMTTYQDIAIKNLDTSLGISMTGGSIENYLQTLAVFYKDGVEKLTQIRESLNNNDLPLFTTHVHALKSASASIGAFDLSEDAKQLELAGKSENMSVINKQCAPFLKKLSAILESIDSYMAIESARHDVGEDFTEDHEYLIKALVQLKQALEEIDISTSDAVLKDLSGRKWMPDTVERLNDISQNVLLFEFEAAIQIINEMLFDFHLG